MNPFNEKNVRLYRWFTISYNARAYYPVLAVLFVDLGLRLEDYSRLNALWAGAILLLEIPSGALADTIGRKKLVVFSAVLMMAEMGLLLFAPINGGALLIGMCVVNRLLSGVSEAAASGADQALAYDSLEVKGQANLWEEKVLPVVMRWRSAAFMIAMLMGGVLYDPSLVNKCCGFFGWETAFTQEQTLRFPLLLVFLQGAFCLAIALKMTDTNPIQKANKASVKEAFRLTIETVKWAFTTRSVAIIIIGTVIIDAFVRNYATVTSEYYREIQLPPWSWGMVGAISGILGMITPELAKWLNKKFSPAVALTIIGGIALIGLIGVGFTIPYYGVIPTIVCISTFGLFGFISDNSLHKLVDSSRRATILSVKGMAMNMGYGLASLIFAQAVVYAKRPELIVEKKDTAFASVLSWQPWAFGILLGLYAIWAFKTKKS